MGLPRSSLAESPTTSSFIQPSVRQRFSCRHLHLRHDLKWLHDWRGRVPLSRQLLAHTKNYACTVYCSATCTDNCCIGELYEFTTGARRSYLQTLRILFSFLRMSFPPWRADKSLPILHNYTLPRVLWKSSQNRASCSQNALPLPGSSRCLVWQLDRAACLRVGCWKGLIAGRAGILTSPNRCGLKASNAVTPGRANWIPTLLFSTDYGPWTFVQFICPFPEPST